MLTTVLLCFLVALSASEQQHNGAWRSNMEYRYKVQTQTLTAIPNLKNQWVGLLTRADLTIHPVSKDVLLGKLKNVQYREWHDSLPNGPTQQPESEHSYQPMEVNTKPFEIRMNQGAIHSIAVDKDMTNVELNQLKSILSQLQVDIQPRNWLSTARSHLPENNYNEDNDSQALYKVMEPTITGKCETVYDISRVPMYLAQTYTESNSEIPMEKDDYFYEVFKSKNYTNCEQRMGYHFGINGLNDWKPNTNNMGSLSKSAVSRIVLSGSFKKFTIRSSVTTNRVVKANPDKESQHDSVVVSQVNLTLTSMEENNVKPQTQSEQLIDVGNLVYSYDLPSDAKNNLRPKMDSSEEVDDYNNDNENSARNSNRSFNDEDENENDNQDDENNNEHQKKSSRSRRSARRESQKNRRNNRRQGSEEELYELSTDENDAFERKREFYQPKPTLRNAPENPMLSLLIGNKGRSIQNMENFNGPAEAEKLAEEIARDLEDVNEIPKKNTLRKYNILAKVIRTMNKEQIQETTRRIEKRSAEQKERNEDQRKDAEKSHKVYRDALISAGTGPAVTEIMEWIEERKVKGEEAAELISALPKNIREPTEEMQKRFFEFVKNDAVRKQSNVNTTAGIAFTRFIHQAQVNNKTSAKYYPVETYGRMSNRNSKFVPEKVIPYFAELLEAAERRNDVSSSLYAIRALGNIGHHEVPSVFEPYLMGKKSASDFKRLAMVLALDKYVANYPHSAPIALYNTYLNKGETSEIRAAALFQLIRNRPIPLVLQRMAEQTNTEENKDIKAAVRSALESIARMNNPENADFAKSARSALNLLKPEKEGIQYSRTHLRDYAIREMDASYHQQSSYIVNKDSFIPNGIFAESVGDLGGFKRKAEFQAIVSSIEELMNAFNDNVKSWKSSNRRSNDNGNDDNDENNTDEMNRNSNQRQSKWSAEKIIKLLNMKPNKAKQMEGQMWFNIMNTERFFTFDKQTLEQMPENAKKLVNELRNGVDLKYTKFFNHEDLTMSFPLETGLPFTFTYRTPSLIQVNGKVQARTTPDIVDDSQDALRMPESLNLTAEIDAVYSVLSEVTVSFINPSTRQRYSAGYDKKVQVNIPVRIQSDIDVQNREIQTEVKPLNMEKSTKVLQTGSWPFTTRDDFLKLRPLSESEHTKEIHTNAERETRFNFGEKTTGFEFNVEGTHEKDSNQITNAYKAFMKHDMTSFLMFGQQNTSPQHYSLNVILDPRRSSSKSAKITVKYDNNDDESTNEQGKTNWNHPRSRGQSADGSENLAIPDSTEPNSAQRRQQFLRNAAEGMPASNGANVVDISVEFKGSKKREYIATISSANSKTDGKSRVLVFAQKSSEKENSKDKPAKGVYLQVDAKYQTTEELRQEKRDQMKPHAEVDFKLSYALDNSLELAKLRGRVEMKQSSEFRAYMQEQSNTKSTTESQSPNTVDHIKVELDVKDVPTAALEKETGVKASNVYNYIRYSTLGFSDENLEYEGKKDEITIEMRFANDMESANFTLKTPTMKTEWNGIAVPKMSKNFAVVPNNWNLLEELRREVIHGRDNCVIAGSEINTFDNRTVKHAHLGNTWHLAVHKMRDSENVNENENGNRYENKNKDNKREHYVSVLVRDAERNNEQEYNQRENNQRDNNNNQEDNEQQSQNRNDQERQNQRKEVLIVLHQEKQDDITLRLAPRKDGSSTPRFFVDEKEKQFSSSRTEEVRSKDNPNEIMARVYVMEERQGKMQEERTVRVETNVGNLEVNYDGKNVQIRSNGILRNNRGVCGAFTGQSANEMKSPDNKIINNDKDFVTSWAVVEDDSDAETKRMQRRIKEKSYPKEELMFGSPIPNIEKSKKPRNQHNNEESDSMDWEERRDNGKTESKSNKNAKTGTKHQTQFYEDFENQRICFSKRPLPVCPSGTKANGKTIQNVEVHCREITDSAAQQYKEQLKRGRNVDMSSHHANDKIKFSVPKRCQPK